MIEISNEEDVEGYGTYRMNHDGSITVTSQGNLPVIEDVLIDVDTLEQFYLCRTDMCDEEHMVLIPKQKAITGDGLYEFVNEGIDVDIASKKNLPGVLRQQERELYEAGYEPIRVYSEVGVRKCILYGRNIYVFAGDDNPVTHEYCISELKLGLKGSCEEWIKFVNKEFADNPAAMLVICFALSSILRVMLGKAFPDEDNLLLHLAGSSSTSKTTMMQLAVSAFGNPSLQSSSGLVSTFYTTENALLQRVLSGQGLVFGIDEVSMLKSKDLTSLIYSLSSGRSKGRLNKDSTYKKTKTAKNFFVTTGEARITGKTNGNAGIYMRVLEFTDVKWTSGSKQAERVKRFVSKNYGSAAIEFGSKLGMLIDMKGQDYLAELFEGCREEYIRRMSGQPRVERLSARYGLITLTAALAYELIGLNADPEQILEFISQYNDENQVQKTIHDFYDELSQILSASHLHFGRFDYVGGKKKYITASLEDWGFVEDDIRQSRIVNGRKVVCRYYIKPVYFDKIATTQLGAEDAEVFASQLKREGYIRVPESAKNKRNTVQKRVGKTNIRYIAINIFGSDIPDDDETDDDSEFVEVDQSMIPFEFEVDRKSVDPIYNKSGL